MPHLGPPPRLSGALDLHAQDTVSRVQLTDDVLTQADRGEVVVDVGWVASGPGGLEDEELGAADRAVREPGHAHRARRPLVVRSGRLGPERVARSPVAGAGRVARLDHPVDAAP